MVGKKLTTEEFIKRAKLIHNDKFDYSLVNYKNSQTKISIICPIHGIFEQIPNSHLIGRGCNKCAIENRKLSTEDFVKKSQEINGNKYDYSLSKYRTSKHKIKIKCNKCNELFETQASIHLEGYGCPNCKTVGGYSKSDWISICSSDKNKIPLVYIIRCFNNDENFLKIGRTSQTVNRRFHCEKSMPYSYEIIKEIKGSADFVFDKERELHKLYCNFNYAPKLQFDGKTECFNISILNDLKFNC